MFIPLIYALMPERTIECYMRVLNVLIQRKVRTPDMVILDFEKAEITAFERSFRGIQVRLQKHSLLFIFYNLDQRMLVSLLAMFIPQSTKVWSIC